MSIFSWFKSSHPAPQAPESFARTVAPGVIGQARGDLKNGASRTGETAADVAARRKSERARLRDLLYNVVRESMVRVGVLSSSFKFKVLATDPRGRKFIVMMDLSREFGSEISQLAEIEALICQSAKARHNIVVSSVYWRALPAMVDTQTASVYSGEKYRATVPSATNETPSPKIPDSPKPKFDPVLTDEITALKRALATGGAVVAPTPAETLGIRKPINPAFLTGFENTEIIESEMPEHDIAETEMLDDDVPCPALSPTQYGELR